MSKLEKMFAAVDEDEFLKFESIENPRHPRPDLCAFLLLHELQPEATDMISASAHDEFFLSIDVGKLGKVISQEDVVTLVRCGVRYSEYDCLAMFT